MAALVVKQGILQACKTTFIENRFIPWYSCSQSLFYFHSLLVLAVAGRHVICILHVNIVQNAHTQTWLKHIYISYLLANYIYLSSYLKQNALSNYIFGKGSESRATDGRVMVAPLDFCGSAACSFKKNAWFVLWNCNFFPVYTYNKQHTPLEINKLTNWHD